MPNTGPIKTFQGPVANVKTSKRDGSPLITSKGNPWAIIGFKNDDGSWLNLSSFDFNNNAILTPGAMVKVGYTEEQQMDGFGQPKMYQGQVQWNRTITAVALLDSPAGATQTAQNAQPTSGATPHSLKPAFDPELSARQTAANDATQIVSAMIRAAGPEGTGKALFDEWEAWAALIHKWLIKMKSDGDQFKEMMEKTEKTLGATPVAAEATPAASTTDEDPNDLPF